MAGIQTGNKCNQWLTNTRDDLSIKFISISDNNITIENPYSSKISKKKKKNF